jgi:sugar phosphate isomerase/epimerase
LQIAVQTRCLAQPLRQALHTAGTLGFTGVQIDAREELRPAELSDTGVRQVRKMLDDLNLRVASATFASRRGFADSQDLERRLTATGDAMRMAGRLSARVLVLATGTLPATSTPERSTLVEALTSLAAQSGRLGVELALQCGDAGPDEVLALLAELPQGMLGVDLNPAEIIRGGRSPRDVAARLAAHVRHVYANDAVRGLGGAAAVDVQLGRGEAGMPELLGALEEFEYRGWITVAPRNSRRPAEECGDALAYLRAL